MAGEIKVNDPLIGHWMMCYIRGVNPKHNNRAGFQMMARSNSTIRTVLRVCAKATEDVDDKALMLDLLEEGEDAMLAAVAATPHYGSFADRAALRAALLNELPARVRRQLAGDVS